jgi:phage gp46-like protein
MAGLDFKLDKDGDMIPSADGWFEEDDSSTAVVAMQLEHHFGQWWGDPAAGSRLFLAHDQGDGPLGEEFLRVEVLRALKPVVQAGRISNLAVEVARTQPGRLVASLSYRDTSTGQVVDAQFDPFGG